jgi:hypothetical protein
MHPYKFILPARMEVGIDCWRRSTNRNILLFGGRKPNLSAISTMANPMGGIKNSLVIVIAIVERRPKCELPGPAFIIYSVILYTVVTKKNWKFILEVYIEKRIDKKNWKNSPNLSKPQT